MLPEPAPESTPRYTDCKRWLQAICTA